MMDTIVEVLEEDIFSDFTCIAPIIYGFIRADLRKSEADKFTSHFQKSKDSKRHRNP